MSAQNLTRLEHAVLRDVAWGRTCWDGRTEAGKTATITGCVRALERLRAYGFVAPAWNVVTPSGHDALARAAVRIGRRATSRGVTELGMVLILAAIAIFVVVLFIHNQAEQERCEARGGVFYCADKLSCLCLAKGTVLP